MKTNFEKQHRKEKVCGSNQTSGEKWKNNGKRGENKRSEQNNVQSLIAVISNDTKQFIALIVLICFLSFCMFHCLFSVECFFFLFVFFEFEKVQEIRKVIISASKI